MPYRNKKILIFGAGPVGLACALAIQEQLGCEVTIQTDKLPGQGITADRAAGIGCLFQPSSDEVARMVIESYPHSMQLAENPDVPYIHSTKLYVVKTGQEAQYEQLVKNYKNCGPGMASYDTFAFDPVEWNRARVRQFEKNGGKIIIAGMTPEQVKVIQAGESVARYDLSLAFIGLKLRDIKPNYGLYPVRGVLVHFNKQLLPTEDGLPISYMDEANCLYAISRPRGTEGKQMRTVLGGTFHEHISVCDQATKWQLAKDIVKKCNKAFSLGIKFMPTKVTVDYRPAVAHGQDIIFDIRPKVGFVGGTGSQGFVPWYALGRRVCSALEMHLQ